MVGVGELYLPSSRDINFIAPFQDGVTFWSFIHDPGRKHASLGRGEDAGKTDHVISVARLVHLEDGASLTATRRWWHQLQDQLNAVQLSCLDQANSPVLSVQFATASVQAVGYDIREF